MYTTGTRHHQTQGAHGDGKHVSTPVRAISTKMWEQYTKKLPDDHRSQPFRQCGADGPGHYSEAQEGQNKQSGKSDVRNQEGIRTACPDKGRRGQNNG